MPTGLTKLAQGQMYHQIEAFRPKFKTNLGKKKLRLQDELGLSFANSNVINAQAN